MEDNKKVIDVDYKEVNDAKEKTEDKEAKAATTQNEESAGKRSGRYPWGARKKAAVVVAAGAAVVTGGATVAFNMTKNYFTNRKRMKEYLMAERIATQVEKIFNERNKVVDVTEQVKPEETEEKKEETTEVSTEAESK